MTDSDNTQVRAQVQASKMLTAQEIVSEDGVIICEMSTDWRTYYTVTTSDRMGPEDHEALTGFEIKELGGLPIQKAAFHIEVHDKHHRRLPGSKTITLYQVLGRTTR